MIIIKVEDWAGHPAGVLTAKPKEFSTGSRGYFATGKVEIEGKRYQVQVNLVEIGSRPKENGQDPAPEIAEHVGN